MVEAAIRRGYEVTGAGPRHPTDPTGRRLGDRRRRSAVAAAVAIGVATRSWIAVAVAAAVRRRRRRPGPSRRARRARWPGARCVRSDAAWDGLAPDHVGPYHGWSGVVVEPQRYAGATRVLLEIEGERHELWVRGRARQQRVGRLARRRPGARRRRRGAARPRPAPSASPGSTSSGSFDAVVGRRRPLRAAASPSPPTACAALIERGASTLPADQSALARGLVIGDDRDQPPEMVQRFRDSGLAHLTAVSGQNVAFLLAAAGPLLARARPFARWALSLGADRLVRRPDAGRAVGAAGRDDGRPRRDRLRPRPTSATRCARSPSPSSSLLLLDPLLAWSVGLLAVRRGDRRRHRRRRRGWRPRLRRLGPLAMPVAVTLGAQVGVALPSLLVFGRLSLVGTFANLVAVPVAGLVMLYGLPACLLGRGRAGHRPASSWRRSAGARAGSTPWPPWPPRLEPPAPWSAIGWVVLALAVDRRRRVGRPRRAAAMMATDGRAPADRRRRVDPARRASRELVHELVGDGDRSLMVDEFDGDDVEVARRRRRRPDPAVPHRAARRRRSATSGASPPTTRPARRLPRPIRCRRPSWCSSAAAAGWPSR